MKILITGINGFVGSHLANLCIGEGDEVYGTIRNRSDLSNLVYLEVKDKVKLIECELTDATNVDNIIKEIKPDKIFHLAAQSYVPTSWKSPAYTLTNNIVSEVNIFEAVRRFIPECKIMVTGSSEEYGNPHYTPIPEAHPLNPVSPYGVSKVAQDKLACQYVMSYDLKIVVTRAFNHTGVLRHKNFVCATFAKQVAETKNGETIKVGNLEAIRDFTDVRDMVKAYYMALDAGYIKFGTPYNICSQKGYTIQFVLDHLIKYSGKKFNIKQDPDRMRPSDLKELIGDSKKFREVTGWENTIPFAKTLEDMYDYYLMN